MPPWDRPNPGQGIRHHRGDMIELLFVIFFLILLLYAVVWATSA